MPVPTPVPAVVPDAPAGFLVPAILPVVVVAPGLLPVVVVAPGVLPVARTVPLPLAPICPRPEFSGTVTATVLSPASLASFPLLRLPLLRAVPALAPTPPAPVFGSTALVEPATVAPPPTAFPFPPFSSGGSTVVAEEVAG